MERASAAGATVRQGRPAILAGARGSGMSAAAPVSIAMDALTGGGGFYLHILGAGGRRLMRLGPFLEEDVLAEWQRLCGTTGLAMAIRLPNGSFLALHEQIGPVRCGGVPIPPRRLALNGRRPRFLSRRKPGLIPIASGSDTGPVALGPEA